MFKKLCVLSFFLLAQSAFAASCPNPYDFTYQNNRWVLTGEEQNTFNVIGEPPTIPVKFKARSFVGAGGQTSPITDAVTVVQCVYRIDQVNDQKPLKIIAETKNEMRCLDTNSFWNLSISKGQRIVTCNSKNPNECGFGVKIQCA